jgi:hypothetical protein
VLLKYNLAKLIQETHLPWPKLLTLALLHLRNTLGKLGITPFELLYGCPFLTNDLILDGETARLTSQITQLVKFQHILTELHQGISHAPSSTSPHFCPSELVLVKIPHISREPWSPYGRGHTLCFFPSQQESVWLDWNLGSTSPESSTGTPQRTLLLKTWTQRSCSTPVSL